MVAASKTSVAVSHAPDHEKDRLYDLIASYVVRRALCYLTAKNYNNVFVEVAAHLKTRSVTSESLAGFFVGKAASDTVRFPSDDELEQAIRVRPQYGWIPQNRLRLILEELEFAARDKFNINGQLQDGLSIEHVMPQSWTTHWPLRTGEFAPADPAAVDEATRIEMQRREALIHCLPNLTLLTPPASSQIGNGDFATKKVRLADSLLKTNVAIAAEAGWDEDTIERRAGILASLAKRVWPFPYDQSAS